MIKQDKSERSNIYAKAFSQRVRILRVRDEITQRDLAKALGISPSRVASWEQYGVIPRIDILVDLANFFNVSIDYLVGKTQEMDLPVDGAIELNEASRRFREKLLMLDKESLQIAENLITVAFPNIFKNV